MKLALMLSCVFVAACSKDPVPAAVQKAEPVVGGKSTQPAPFPHGLEGVYLTMLFDEAKEKWGPPTETLDENRAIHPAYIWERSGKAPKSIMIEVPRKSHRIKQISWTYDCPCRAYVDEFLSTHEPPVSQEREAAPRADGQMGEYDWWHGNVGIHVREQNSKGACFCEFQLVDTGVSFLP